jgi:4-oxalocrotonate tautomerase
MPVINIELTREGVTREQKRQLIKQVSEVVTNILNKDPFLTHVVIREIDTDNWGYGGEQVSVMREQGIMSDKK